MIKVIEVSSDSNIGGAGKCILTFLRTFDREKFDVCLVLPKGSLLKAEAEKYKIKIFEIEHLAEKSLDIKAISRLKKLFRRLQPDVVHTHASMSARIAAKLCGVRIVYTRHSVFPPPKRISRGLGRKVNGFVNNHTADRIIAVAEAAKDNLTATGIDEQKISVILNGVDALAPMAEDKKAAARSALGIPEGVKVAAIVARLNAVKGHKDFVEAARILKARGMETRFVIAGTGEMEDAIREQIRENQLEDTVIMTGFLKDVAPLMNVLDVQVNCSFGTEATSLSLLEGMSLGKPAVVTDFGGNPGVIKDGENGYLVPVHEPEILADRIEKLFRDDEEYRRMSENAKKIYQETFTAVVNTRKIEKIYAALCADEVGGRIDESEI